MAQVKEQQKKIAAPVEESGKELVQRAETAVAAIDYGADSGAGLENIKASDLALPFITILQKGSPQVDEANGKFIEGVMKGQIFNTVTLQTFDGVSGIKGIPCAYSKKFVEWVPRSMGGGWVASYEPGSAAVKACILVPDSENPKKKRLMTPGGNMMVETAYHYFLQVVDGASSWTVVAMDSSDLRTSRVWNSLYTGIKISLANGGKITPAMYSHVYQLTAKKDQKDTFTWFRWEVTLVGRVTDPNLYADAKSYSEAVRSGAVNITPGQVIPVEENVDVEQKTGEEVPF